MLKIRLLVDVLCPFSSIFDHIETNLSLYIKMDRFSSKLLCLQDPAGVKPATSCFEGERVINTPTGVAVGCASGQSQLCE